MTARASKRGRRYVQADGIARLEVDGQAFLIDARHGAIHHLDPLASALWGLFAEPREIDEVRAALCAAFPDQPPARIGRDLGRLVRELREAGLLVAAETG